MTSPTETPEQEKLPTENQTETETAEPKPTYVKLAMRNMVRKGGKSLKHFLLTTIGFVALMVGLSYLTR